MTLQPASRLAHARARRGSHSGPLWDTLTLATGDLVWTAGRWEDADWRPMLFLTGHS